MTPDQQQQLNNWSAERDKLLGDISRLNNEKELLTKKISELSDNKTELTVDLVKIETKTDQLENQYALRNDALKSKYETAKVEMSSLQEKMDIARGSIVTLNARETDLQKSIKTLTDAHEALVRQHNSIEHLLMQATQITEKSIGRVNEMLNNIKLVDKSK